MASSKNDNQSGDTLAVGELRKEYGKITRATFGAGGYQEAQVGLWLLFEGKGWGCGHGIAGGWNFPPDSNAKWTLEDQSKSYATMVRDIMKLLADAKVDSVDKLMGKPVECKFEFTTLKSFRIFTEVL